MVISYSAAWENWDLSGSEAGEGGEGEESSWDLHCHGIFRK
jgi:hypothetical protein